MSTRVDLVCASSELPLEITLTLGCEDLEHTSFISLHLCTFMTNVYKFSGTSETARSMISDNSHYTNNWTYLPTQNGTEESGVSVPNNNNVVGQSSSCQPVYIPMDGYSGLVPNHGAIAGLVAGNPNQEPMSSSNSRWTGPRDEQMTWSHKRRLCGMKRKSNEGSEWFGRACKARMTDEHMANRMSELTIDFGQLGGNQTVSDNQDEDAMVSDVELEMSDVLKQALLESRNKEIIPKNIAEKISNPCTALVLWQEPNVSSIIPVSPTEYDKTKNVYKKVPRSSPVSEVLHKPVEVDIHEDMDL